MSTLILIGVFFAGLIVFHTLEHKTAHPIDSSYVTGIHRRGYWADFTASIANGPALSALTKIGAIHLIMMLPNQPRWLSSWHWTAQFALFLLVNDFGRYWLHRWYHVSNFLWRFHRVHHTAVEMDSLSTFRVHFFEAVIKYGLIILPFHVLGIAKSALILYSSIDILKGFWHHANFQTYIGKFNYWLNSAELHWWHHSTEQRGQRSNYGSLFSIWDRMFGTFYYNKGNWPETIGVDGMAGFPDTYLEQFVSMRLDDQTLQHRFQESQEGSGDANSTSESDPHTADALPTAR